MKILDVEQVIADKRQQRAERAERLTESMRERQERLLRRKKDEEEYYEEQIRKHADFVSQCLSEYSPVRLHIWFRLDHWTVQEGLLLLSGFDPKAIPLNEKGEIAIPFVTEERRKMREMSFIRRLDNLTPFKEMTEDLIGETRSTTMAWDIWQEHAQILRIWKSGAHNEERYPPKYFIEWAISKRLPIDWLDWAKAEGYYGNLPKKEPGTDSEKPLASKEKNNLLNLIGALQDLYWNAAHPGEEYKQTTMLAELERYKGFGGLSESQLKRTLPAAKKAIES